MEESSADFRVYKDLTDEGFKPFKDDPSVDKRQKENDQLEKGMIDGCHPQRDGEQSWTTHY